MKKGLYIRTPLKFTDGTAHFFMFGDTFYNPLTKQRKYTWKGQPGYSAIYWTTQIVPSELMKWS